jgi:tRNA uridine 5-carboxymethylaminomethyl modification enzyme
MKKFDVVVVGGGHAGVEAACVAFRMKKSVLLVTMSRNNIGEISCNPAIGGIGKGTIVKEIDALDGVMPKIADMSGINFKVLNRSRGPAVWGLRAQIDRVAYRNNLNSFLDREYSGLKIVEDLAEEVLVKNNRVVGVLLKDLGVVHAKSLIFATGTFLDAVMHRGFDRLPGGRIGESSACLLYTSDAADDM